MTVHWGSTTQIFEFIMRTCHICLSACKQILSIKGLRIKRRKCDQEITTFDWALWLSNKKCWKSERPQTDQVDYTNTMCVCAHLQASMCKMFVGSQGRHLPVVYAVCQTAHQLFSMYAHTLPASWCWRTSMCQNMPLSYFHSIETLQLQKQQFEHICSTD